jgi:hypothetical protein
MALVRYKCSNCGKEALEFTGEDRIKELQLDCVFEPMPPDPVVVHATNSFTSTELMLDSVWSIHDLDRQLNIEVSDETEAKMYNRYSTSI